MNDLTAIIAAIFYTTDCTGRGYVPGGWMDYEPAKYMMLAQQWIEACRATGKK